MRPTLPLTGLFQKKGFEILQDFGKSTESCYGDIGREFRVYSFSDGKPVGECYFTVWDEKNYISMTHIEVLEEERRQGYAREMIRHVASFARDNGKSLWINAVPGTREFYTQCVTGLFEYPDFIFPEDNGYGYCPFMIPKEKIRTLSEKSTQINETTSAMPSPR